MSSVDDLRSRYLVRYGLCGFRGEGQIPGWLTSASTLGELADLIGCDGLGLEETESAGMHKQLI